MQVVTQKFENIVESTKNWLSIFSDKIKRVMKEYENRFNAEEKLAKESRDAILSLQDYAKSETPQIAETFNSWAESMNIIENNRVNMVKELRSSFRLMNDLINAQKALDRELKEKKSAEKAYNKAHKRLEKEKGKSPEKQSKDDLLEYQKEFDQTKKTLQKESKNVEQEMESFQNEKIEKLTKIVNDLVQFQREFHSQAVDEINKISQVAQQIDKQKEIDQVKEQLEIK